MTADPIQITGNVLGVPRTILRLEGALVLAGTAFAYAHTEGSIHLFLLIFLVPDLSMLGYLAGRAWGAAIYNFSHSYLAPAALLGLGFLQPEQLAVQLGLIWMAHIGFDRMVGYGLKYRSGFAHTHLGVPRWHGVKP
ncbi:DUF4260 domain-containing protein [Novosphingobium sp.]|uniref:DUF4260 domain-containing protein n=1 Tax=Novosphingobium sp. TaxID=1874826 RepID=UPI003BAC189C